MDKGILIIACGHPYWGGYAENLAASLRANLYGGGERKVNIALAYAGDAMQYMGLSLIHI